MKRALILTGIAILCRTQLNAQSKLWDGGGSDSLWTNPLNWADDIVPGLTDEVLLDNSIVLDNYAVKLPAGSASTSISKLTMIPSANKTVRLIIPSINTANPGLNITGIGDALILNKGAVLVNATGVGSGGVGLNIAGTFRINNGGRYIHQNVRGNAAIVSQLSSVAGTEEGIFEFDIPSGAGTLSLNGRTFGHLVLSATAAAGVRTYTATGNSAITINGNLEINPGVTFSYGANVSTITVKKNLVIAAGATFNIANGANSSLVNVKGDLTVAGTIRESGASTGSGIELSGNISQHVTVTGTIADTVFFRIDNTAGIILNSPLSLPYSLQLQKGQVTTSLTNMLTLQRGCTLQADSLSGSFIDGPLRKEGLANASKFLFPVGKNNMHRWMELKNATGNFIIEYHRADPHSLSFITDPDINHISGLEYWSIKADALPIASALIELSFDNAYSGGVTSLTTLLVARFKVSPNGWNSLGNAGTTGIASANGSVIAATYLNDFIHEGDCFTLATNSSSANPLPLLERTIPPIQRQSSPVTLRTRLFSIFPTLIKANKATLTILAEKDEQISIAFINQLGQVMQRQSFFLTKGNNRLLLDVSGLMAGVYYVTGYAGSRFLNTIQCIKL